MAKILMAEDDLSVSESVEAYLEAENHKVDLARDGQAALEFIRSIKYDLMILDWQLPFVSGVEICRQFRQQGGQTPILMLTGMSTISNKEEGFTSGADDYLTKPFNVRELMLRVDALLRRPAQIASEVLAAGDLVFDVSKRLLTKGGAEIKLQPHELSVLEFFLKNPNRIVTPEELLQRVWDTDNEASVYAVYTCLNRLRKHIKTDGKPDLIQTYRGQGYKFVPPS